MLMEFYAHLVFPPSTVETCIIDALNRLDIGPAGDTYGMDQIELLGPKGMLNEAKQDFLFACALFKLIPEPSIESILGDKPMQDLPVEGKYVSVSLVQQFTTDPSKIKERIDELEKMEGNSGEIAVALVNVRRRAPQTVSG